MDVDTTNYGESYNYDDTYVREADRSKSVEYAVADHAVKAYKKIWCETVDKTRVGAVAELMIPRGALVRTVTFRDYYNPIWPLASYDILIEYKTDTYRVTKITPMSIIPIEFTKCYSIYDNKFEYKVDGIYNAKIKNGLWFHRWRDDAFNY